MSLKAERPDRELIKRGSEEDRDQGRRKRLGGVLSLLLNANGRCIWEADDSVGWEDGKPRQTMRGYAVGGVLLVMIESDGGIDVMRSISPTNSLDDLGEAIARISRGEPEPQATDQAQHDCALKVLGDGETVAELVAAAVMIVAAARRWPRVLGADSVIGLSWGDHLEPLRAALRCFAAKLSEGVASDQCELSVAATAAGAAALENFNPDEAAEGDDDA